MVTTVAALTAAPPAVGTPAAPLAQQPPAGSGWSLVDPGVPASLGAGDGWLVQGLADADAEVDEDSTGLRDHARPAPDHLSRLQRQGQVRRLRVLAVADDPDDRPDPARVLGYAAAQLPVLDNTATAHVDVAVRPAHRGRGIGTALHRAAVESSQALGRTVLMASTNHRAEPAPGPRALEAPTGSGRVDRDAPGVRFALAHGYRLEQVARYSAIALPVDPDLLDALLREARAAAGPAYRTLSWEGPAPEEHLADLVRLATSMSTDEPVGGFAMEVERWDAERLRTSERERAGMGLTPRTVVAQHVATGRLVGYSTVDRRGLDPVAEQEDTLVLAEHRGHRLGMLMKAEQLRALAVEQPQLRRIGTWNVEENGPMLAINVALGFRPAGSSGEWQRKLTDR